MTALESTFDIISHDPHPNARAGLMTVLDVEGAIGPYGAGAPYTGTPVPGSIYPGMIVVMNNAGNAEIANNNPAPPGNVAFPAMLFVAIDGDRDFDGAFVHRITCIQGGMEIVTDLYVPNPALLPGVMLTCGDDVAAPPDYSGYFRIAVKGEQIYGMVGSDGIDATVTPSTLHIIIPQGISPALP